MSMRKIFFVEFCKQVGFLSGDPEKEYCYYDYLANMGRKKCMSVSVGVMVNLLLFRYCQHLHLITSSSVLLYFV